MNLPQVISVELARALRDSGLVWHPRAGDAFIIDLVEADDEIFVLSDMTVEAHEFSTGTVLGFNGTTEWALDSVAIDEALWLPHEHQLRALLGAAFVSLAAGFSVAVTIDGVQASFRADAAAHAYARALLALLDSLAPEQPDDPAELVK
ncbi:MAG: pilus assembly protein CpaE [Rhodoglobus sp.]